jgi:hypothetical protein
MTTKLENIKFELFTAKEHYLAFRQAWKDYINAGKHKPDFEVCPYGGGKKKISNLTAAQQLLFCILTEKDLSVVFKRSSNPDKPNGFENAYWRLRNYLRMAQKICQYERGENPFPSHIPRDKHADLIQSHKDRLDTFLEPFGKSLTYQMLNDIYRKLNDTKITNKKEEEKEAA